MKKMYRLVAVGVSLLFVAGVLATTSMAQEASKPLILRFANPVPQQSWFGN